LAPIVDGHVYDLLWVFSDHAYFALPTSARRGLTIVDLNDFEDQRNVHLARQDARRGRTARVFLAMAEIRALTRDLARIASSVDLATISSEIDRQRLGLASVRVLPNGYRMEGPPQGSPDVPRTLTVLYAASFNYGPNLDGLKWLLSEIWPLVRQRSPEAELRLVGRGIPAGAIGDVPGVRDLGRIPDMAVELARASAVVVPLRSGSGTRVKILEAWAHRVPVVSTTIASSAGRSGATARDESS
jgi:glycosyltransferase involved in cell wall biosynthesis